MEIYKNYIYIIYIYDPVMVTETLVKWKWDLGGPDQAADRLNALRDLRWYDWQSMNIILLPIVIGIPITIQKAPHHTPSNFPWTWLHAGFPYYVMIVSILPM